MAEGIGSMILEDGTVELTIRLSKEEVSLLNSLNTEDPGAAHEEEVEWDERGIFKNKASYRLRCGASGEEHTIKAYGDIHAHVKAVAYCGGAYRLSPGKR
jgi:hypothetical protein